MRILDEEDLAMQAEIGRRKTVQWLIVSGLITVLLWQTPFGGLTLYPFTILATWFHEMGHGLTAMLLGGHFDRLLIFANGSGLAYHSSVGRLGDALVSAGGLLGPPIAGTFFILSGSHAQRSRLVLGGLGAALLLSTLIWVRSGFGWLMLPLLGVSLLITSLKGPAWLQPMVVQFLGVQACISTYHQLDYLFMGSAVIGGQMMASDTGQIANALLLPYWIWGGLIAAISFVLLAGSLWTVGRKPAPSRS